MAINIVSSSLPLHEQIPRKNTIARVIELVILFLLFSLLVYRIVSLKHHENGNLIWLLALLCESWFTLNWILVICIKWTQFEYKTYPQRLLQRRSTELPAVDMFVTTADAILEPPILTVNTVLSLLAVDYPVNKLGCYVSDDGCSPLTFYSLVEAAKFAKLWVPFCKKYEIPIRAPFRYFTPKSMPSHNVSLEFQQEWKNMKDAYGQLCKRIEHAAQRSVPCDLTGEFAVFSNVQRTSHPTIVKVIWENKEGDPNGLPHLVYISREKRPKHPHHFKAGAMNVLARVSGVMTNAPFMLNVDCDMYANNPQIILHAMCLLLGVENKEEHAFVQCPQHFYDGLKDDPFGNQMLVLHEYLGRGMAALQGPFYGGTGCFHRRKVIYGLSPDEKVNTEKLGNWDLQKEFGKSIELRQSAAQTLSGSNSKTSNQMSLSSSVEAANQVANCGYEYGTIWGTQVGWIYGSATEDILTGLTIHGRGWRSAYCTPSPPAFLGCAPTAGPASLNQQKRWATGLLEILFSLKSPLIAAVKGKLQFRQCLAYMWILMWGIRSIPELCYAALPAYCIMTNSYFLPKVNEPAIILPMGILVIYNLYGLSEYIRIGLSIRMWWNYQRMSRITSLTAWLFGFVSAILKLLGLSQTMFEVTQKEQNTSDDDDDDNANANANAKAGRFTFDKSPMFVPGVAVLLVNLTALTIEVSRLQLGTSSRNGPGLGEIICSVWVLLFFWAFLKGLFGNGKYGIPSSTIWKSGALAFLFVYFCIRASRG